ncbi:MAG: ABC transporter ATP-binding protein [Acidimicrobiia bacterium]|nr:ABC transporter ATP-binding protein [Acidimicrobiia bacterium]MYG57762.1 ABC transporter ATP-binding protein [Acidimicrobiia bacterium]MYJ33357.1 ABC transporter ATP-binding protein [Acidimicrobiia bacterium]
MNQRTPDDPDIPKDQGPDDNGQDDEDQEALQKYGREALRYSGRMSAPMPAESSRNFRGTVRQLAKITGRETPILILVMVLAVMSVSLTVIGPWLLGGATDIIVTGVREGGIDTDRLRDRLLTIGGVFALAWALGHVQNYLLSGALQRSMFRLRETIEAKLHRLPLSYVDQHARGDLLSRVTNDIDNLSQSLQQTINQMLTAVLTLVGVTVMMLTVSPLLALVAFVTVPLSVVATRIFATRARPRFLRQWRTTGTLNAQAEDVVSGHAIVTAFGRQDQERQRFADENAKLYDSSRAAQFLSSAMQPVMMLMGNLQFVSVAVVGGLRISSGAITIGDMQAMIQYTRQFAMPVQQVASMAATFQSGIASLERVVELLEVDEISADPEPAHHPPTRGRVAFEEVHFSYDPEKALITGLDLTAEPGQTVAIVGPTGAGKTTLVNLLLRFYELDGGRITLDGVDITAIPRQELRSKFGMVLQDTWLFGDTIWENLRYGNPDATDAQIIEAARVTYVDRFVHSLPGGYDTVINDEGDNISAGQKQLLTIARAFLADPAILILDEATSSVDTRTEVLIQEAMNALRADRTSFVIAHRLSTIRGADTIVVMDGGHIAEQGSHDELLARGGPYASLHAAQFAGQAT